MFIEKHELKFLESITKEKREIKDNLNESFLICDKKVPFRYDSSKKEMIWDSNFPQYKYEKTLENGFLKIIENDRDKLLLPKGSSFRFQ